MVLNACYPNGKLFCQLVEAMEGVIDECIFTLNRGGIQISRLDTNQVVMVDLMLPRDSFLRYSLTGNTEMEVGVNVGTMKKVLQWMSEDSMDIKVVNRKITFSQKRQGPFPEEREVVVPTCDVNVDEEAQPPETDYTSKVSFSSALFSRILKSHMQHHDTVGLTIEKTKFILDLNNHHHINGRTVLRRQTAGGTLGPNSSGLMIEKRGRRAVSQLLPTTQFRKFGGASDLSGTVEISLAGGESAAKVQFNVRDDGGRLAFYLAPKIETTD